jgi:hypothetical protein
MPNSKLPTEILLSLGTVPVLLVLVGSKALANAIKDMGQASEEIFRGDRLPVLKLSNPVYPPNSTDSSNAANQD